MQSSTLPLRVFDECANTSRIALVFGNADLTRLALYSVARVAAIGHTVWVLDGANSFDAYFVARLARRWNYAPKVLLSRIRLSRAFTSYQMAELVTRRLPSAAEQSSPATIFCLGLPETFYDEDLPITDAMRLVKGIAAQLSQLARWGHTILITACEPRDERRERIVLLNLLKAAAHHVECVGVTRPSDTPTLTQPMLIVA